MKTLDEVITELEDEGVFPDALHYLKEYKIKRERIMAKAQDCEDTEKRLQDEIARYQEAVKNCELAENKYRRLSEGTSQNLEGTTQITCPKCHSEIAILLPENNLPLTWDELRQMEGKPVWVETGTKDGRWGMYDGVWLKDNEDCVMFVYGHRKYAVCKIRLLGKTWNAYRKERE